MINKSMIYTLKTRHKTENIDNSWISFFIYNFFQERKSKIFFRSSCVKLSLKQLYKKKTYNSSQNTILYQDKVNWDIKVYRIIFSTHFTTLTKMLFEKIIKKADFRLDKSVYAYFQTVSKFWNEIYFIQDLLIF